MTSLDHLLEVWQKDGSVRKNIAHWFTDSARPADLVPFPDGLHEALGTILREQGIGRLYRHQWQAFELAVDGKNLVLATGTASGKTLGYNLPILNCLLGDPLATALYIFPTKALTHDQLTGLQRWQASLDRILSGRVDRGSLDIRPAVYDGDTPTNARSTIRRNARILLTNPDMLHTGILPHHTSWAQFFHNLRYVVIDEMHIYRGVFGSHVANVIRRLKRVAQFYGSYPQFVLTSATIANPDELAQRLTEEPVEVIGEDGSPRGLRHFLIYNPPVVQPQTGVRRSSLAESVRLSTDLLEYGVQTLIFARSRRTTELALKYLREKTGNSAGPLHGYRSGYLPGERRKIEQGLRTGTVRGVVATNALELGIDIGGVDATVLIGYPGTIAATRQQAGRAGRKQQSAASIMVASANPLDQFLVQHPRYLLERSPEKGLINPDNPLILLSHLRCAAFELPFRVNEKFGSLPPELVAAYLEVLEENQEIYQSGDRYFWMADKYPAEQVSLRSTSAETVLLQVAQDGRETTIGQVDMPSAPWMVHKNAIYMHEGRTYRVDELDLENHFARLTPVEVDYYTEALKETDIQKIELQREETVPAGKKYLGEIMVTTRLTGFRRLRWYTQEVLGMEDLSLPPSHLRTVGYWLSISPEAIEQLEKLDLWNSDENDYGPDWNVIRTVVRQRDRFTCQMCGAVEKDRAHHVHHRIPFRAFSSPELANQIDNLITLCPSCHRQAENVVRVRSGLSGLKYVMNQLAPLFVMCDVSDLGAAAEPQSPLGEGQPTVVIYDQVPAGIGLSESLYNIHEELVEQAYQLVSNCECLDGCPSCVGAGGEYGAGSKPETLALLALMSGRKLE